VVGTREQATPAAPIRLAARMEKYVPPWLQEPCPPGNDSEMGRVERSTRIPIAKDQRLVTVHEIQQLVAKKACAVVQSDRGSDGFPRPVEPNGGGLADFELRTSARKKEERARTGSNRGNTGMAAETQVRKKKVKNPARLGARRGCSDAKRDSLQRVDGGAGGI
jgi:Enolase C-terminal domain-like